MICVLCVGRDGEAAYREIDLAPYELLGHLDQLVQGWEAAPDGGGALRGLLVCTRWPGAASWPGQASIPAVIGQDPFPAAIAGRAPPRGLSANLIWLVRFSESL